MRTILRFLLVFLLPAVAGVASERLYDITWMTNSDVFKEWPEGNVFPAYMTVKRNEHSPMPRVPANYELAVCSSDFARSYRVKFEKPEEFGEGYSGQVGYLSEKQTEALQVLGDGTYHAAILISGVRCSNVATFTVDGSAKPPDGPSIRVFAIPDLDNDVLMGAGYWVVPAEGNNLKTNSAPMTNMTIAFPPLVVDGEERELQMQLWMGPVGPLTPQKASGRWVEFADYKPAIIPRKTHEVQVVIGLLKSQVTRIFVDRTVERRFDDYFKGK